MKIKELIKEIEKYGDKDIFLSDGESKLEIDSVQKNNSEIVPDYLLIMIGTPAGGYKLQNGGVIE